MLRELAPGESETDTSQEVIGALVRSEEEEGKPEELYTGVQMMKNFQDGVAMKPFQQRRLQKHQRNPL
jgi:hypothetical protein